MAGTTPQGWITADRSRMWSRDPAVLHQAAQNAHLEIFGLEDPKVLQCDGELLLIRAKGKHYVCCSYMDPRSPGYLMLIKEPKALADVFRVADLGELSRYRSYFAIFEKVNPIVAPNSDAANTVGAGMESEETKEETTEGEETKEEAIESEETVGELGHN